MIGHRVPAALLVLPLLASSLASAQDFDSGSTGADGALTFAANAGTIEFDPTTSSPPLDPDGDNVYHFTTITVPLGTTVRLTARRLPEGKPVVWLASGAVTILGVLDLAGENGHAWNATFRPSVPGAGGYSGGVAQTAAGPPTRGNGPGAGGAVGTLHGGHAGHRINGPTSTTSAASGGTYGNDFLLPMIGGSGGGGGGTVQSGGGGAGGGAIVIASSTSIRVTGQLKANGGGSGVRADTSQKQGGGGSGGAIRLIAPLLEGNGTLDVAGGLGNGPPIPPFSTQSSVAAAYGRVRLESFRDTSTFTVNPSQGLVPPAAPGTVLLPPTAPLIKVVRVAGQAVVMSPTGSFDAPDVVIDAPAAVTVELEARHIPPGTVLNLTFQPETGGAFTATATPLTGTVEQSTATAEVQFPHGQTRVFVKATWTP